MADVVKDAEMIDGDEGLMDYGDDDERVQDGLADTAVEGMCAPTPHLHPNPQLPPPIMPSTFYRC